MAATIIKNKIARISLGKRPRVLDLFSGCGGISLGFARAGFDIVGAVEMDPVAAKSHAINFHQHLPEPLRRKHATSRDVVHTEPCDLLRELGLAGRVDSQIDVIVGGPPCQAFARVGRAKLREVAEHPEAFLKDPRSNLYLRYLHYVRELRPVALLMENVPDIINYGGHNIAEEVCEVLADEGYDARYTILNAVFYGVPEMRERMFLVAFRRELQASTWFPEPTHWVGLPKGYHGSRQVALKTIRRDLFDSNQFFVDPPEPDRDRCKPAVTAQEALSDLPRITSHLEGGLKKGPRHFVDPVTYKPRKPLTTYQELMRSWPGFEGGENVVDHVIRFLPRDYAIFSRMNPGDEYPEAHAHAVSLFEERLREAQRTTGRQIRKGSKAYQELWKATVPPYDPGKFPNKWRKMEADKPARTLMAHLGKDSYSHIHYDSSQARTISVREAARLQSFPDGFRFQGPMNPAFRQIGNAVPPLMAFAAAEVIRKCLKREDSHVESKACLKAVGGL